MKVRYDIDENVFVFTVDAVGEFQATPEFLFELLPSERQGLEHLRHRVHEIRRKRIEKIDEFMKKTIELKAGVAKVRERMEKLDPVADAKALKSLNEVTAAYSREQRFLREMRLSIKLLDNEEGRVLAKIAELGI